MEKRGCFNKPVKEEALSLASQEGGELFPNRPGSGPQEAYAQAPVPASPVSSLHPPATPSLERVDF